LWKIGAVGEGGNPKKKITIAVFGQETYEFFEKHAIFPEETYHFSRNSSDLPHRDCAAGSSLGVSLYGGAPSWCARVERPEDGSVCVVEGWDFLRIFSAQSNVRFAHSSVVRGGVRMQ
jgi:hypothetical protein